MTVASEWVYEDGEFVLVRVWVDGAEVPLCQVDYDPRTGKITTVDGETTRDDSPFADAT